MLSFCCRTLTFFKVNLFEKLFQEYHQCQTVLIEIRSDFVGPDLDLNCLHKLSADNTCRESEPLSYQKNLFLEIFSVAL